MPTAETKKHNMLLKSRRELILDGVLDIFGFDEKSVSLDTVCGPLTVEGEELHLTKMSLESGEVALTGEIFGIFYENTRERKTGGFFARFKK